MYSNEKVDNANRVGKKCFVFSLPFFYTLKKKLVVNHPIFRIKTYLSNVMVVFFLYVGENMTSKPALFTNSIYKKLIFYAPTNIILYSYTI